MFTNSVFPWHLESIQHECCVFYCNVTGIKLVQNCFNHVWFVLSTSCFHAVTGEVHNVLVELMEPCIENLDILPSQAFGKMHMGSYSDDNTPDRNCIVCHVFFRLKRLDLPKMTDRNRWKTHQRFNGTGVKKTGWRAGVDFGQKQLVGRLKKVGCILLLLYLGIEISATSASLVPFWRESSVIGWMISCTG